MELCGAFIGSNEKGLNETSSSNSIGVNVWV
jgi:hypothetical protein